MTGTTRLAWRYLAHHPGRSATLVLALALTILFPWGVQLLVGEFQRTLIRRAEQTPLLLGALGSRYDLVLNALYFQGDVARPLSMESVEIVQATGWARPIPLFIRHRAQGFPVVGTNADYFSFRQLRAAQGTLPLLLGDVTLGANVADELGLTPGDTLATDVGSGVDLLQYPLRLSVVGVLQPSANPDDDAVFVDLKTAWVIDGIGHGHDAAEEQGEDQTIARDGHRTVLNAAVFEHAQITDRNRDSFHFHGDRGEYPVTAVLIDPPSDKAATLLRGRYRASDTEQMLRPSVAVDEILGFVARIKRFFDANSLLVGLATALFLAVAVTLSYQLRRRELRTLRKIGCSRRTLFEIFAWESLILVGAAALFAGIAAWGAVNSVKIPLS